MEQFPERHHWNDSYDRVVTLETQDFGSTAACARGILRFDASAADRSHSDPLSQEWRHGDLAGFGSHHEARCVRLSWPVVHDGNELRISLLEILPNEPHHVICD